MIFHFVKSFVCKRFISYIILTVFLLCACRGGMDGNSDLMSLETQCKKLSISQQADSLQIVSKRYRALAPEKTKDAYKALQYELVALFLKGNYKQVIETVSSNPKNHNYPDIECGINYTLARAYQYSKLYDKALSIYKECILYESDKAEERKEISKTITEASLQLMNTYQTMGKPEECVTYFKHIISNPTSIIRQYNLRDIYSIYAYSLSRTERVDEAETIIEKALSMPPVDSLPQSLFRDYAYAAAIFYNEPKRQEDVISWCNAALKESSKYENASGVQWVNSMLGALYKRSGHLEESIDFYMKSIEEARKKNDYAAEANAYADLTSLYLKWNFLEQADEYSSLALQKNLQQKDDNPMLRGIAFVMKGKVMKVLNRPDSALFFWNKADSCCRNLPYDSGMATIDNEIGLLLMETHDRDSISEGIKRLQRVVEKCATINNRAAAYFNLSKCYDKQDDKLHTEQMLDSMYVVLNSGTSPFYIEDAYKFALDYYLKKKDNSNIERYAHAYMRESAYMLDNNIPKNISKAIIHFRTAQKEQELQIANAEIENNRLHMRLYQMFFVILLLVSVWLVYRFRLINMKRRLQEEKLGNMIEMLKEANTRSAEFENQLNSMRQTNEQHAQAIDSLLIPTLFRESGEIKFRERFLLLHPLFLKKLREKVPSITPREEILCMLIILEQTTDQIGDIMCIARNSVNMARHRLRQKMQLEKDDSLEYTIRKWAQG